MTTQIVFAIVFAILGYYLPKLDSKSTTTVSNQGFVLFILVTALLVFFNLKSSPFPILVAGTIILVSFLVGALTSLYRLGGFKGQKIITDSL